MGKCQIITSGLSRLNILNLLSSMRFGGASIFASKQVNFNGNLRTGFYFNDAVENIGLVSLLIATPF